MKYPVVFFVFKRPGTTRQFLDLMAQAGVEKIYLFGDGPRNEDEKHVTDQVKSAVEQFAHDNPQIQLISNFSPTNKGLKNSIISGLNQVFSLEKAAIIIEDDCYPSPDFFRFVSSMLTRYQNEPRIMSINGSSVGGKYRYSYGFTKYSQCWGWATWARAWQFYDPTLAEFNHRSWASLARSLKFDWLMKWYWHTMLTVVKAGLIDTWDFQWSYAHMRQGGLAISPAVNLVSNIGFDQVATNTKTKTRVFQLQINRLQFPLTHPPQIKENLTISHQIELAFYRNPIAILGLLRQYLYWRLKLYAPRS